MKDWSYKQLRDYERCPYKYKLTYIEKLRGKKSIFDYIQDFAKAMLIAVYDVNQDSKMLSNVYEKVLLKAEEAGIKFPSQSIGDGWNEDLRLFFEKFEKKPEVSKVNIPVELKFKELGSVGLFIDNLCKLSDDKYGIISWETSSRFMGDRVDEEGKKLILEKMAIEKELGICVDRVSWKMLRYVYVEYGNRKSIRNRRNWVANTKNPIVKAIEKYDSSLNSEALFKESAKKNSLSNLPEEVREQFELSDCIIEYEFDEFNIENTLDYVESTILEIKKDNQYSPIQIDKSTEFFCNMLCRHRESCKHLKVYKGIELSDRDRKIVDLFG